MASATERVILLTAGGCGAVVGESSPQAKSKKQNKIIGRAFI